MVAAHANILTITMLASVRTCLYKMFTSHSGPDRGGPDLYTKKLKPFKDIIHW